MTTRGTTQRRLVALRSNLAGIVSRQASEVRSAIAGLGKLQATLLVSGALIAAYGGVLMLQLLLVGAAPVLAVGGWWLGGPLIVDLIVVPVVVVAGVGIGRIVPSAWRRYVSAAAALTVLTTLVAFPSLTGFGRRADNPSLLDRDYWAGYLTLVAIIWGVPLLIRFAKTIPPFKRRGPGTPRRHRSRRPPGRRNPRSAST